MIGDEIMSSIADSIVAAEIALALVEAYVGEPSLLDVRVGLAVRPVMSWEGDLFGPTVNLASRLVNIARPGTVLISDELGNQLQGRPSFTLRHLRPVPLKGIGRVRLWVLRRGPADSAILK
jgi:adenylate cyclase